MMTKKKMKIMSVTEGSENVTRRPNTGVAMALRTHCPHGHEYTAKNTILMKVKKDGVYTGQVKRQCRICKSKVYEKKKAAEKGGRV